MLREVLQQLDLRPGLTVCDGTVGAGGHSEKISQAIDEEGTLLGLDRDSMMLELAEKRVHGQNRHLRQASYREIQHVLEELTIESVDRILLDLGLSSDQLADSDRGFGFSQDAPLDMRFDTRGGESVTELLARITESELDRILTDYGEERFSGAIARRVVWIASERSGSGGNGIGLRRTMRNAVRSVSSPSTRSSATRAPNRLAPTPSPVYPPTHESRPSKRVP